MASESVLHYLGRTTARDYDPVAMLVVVPPSEYEQAKEETLRTGTHTANYDDEDGVCKFFTRDGHLHLRTVRGTVKAVASSDMMRSLGAFATHTSVSPLGRFMEACHAAGVSQEQLMAFATTLKDDALLDSILVYKLPNQPHGAFVYVTKFPTGDTLNFETFMPKTLLRCVGNHTVYLALIRREGLNIEQLVTELRRAPAVETLRNLTTRADAIISGLCLTSQ